MAQIQLSDDQLRIIIQQSLSADQNVRSSAENQLAQAKLLPGHALSVLRVVANSDATEIPVRQAAAVHFKNIVKNGWDEGREEGTGGITIPENDRVLIKSHLVELMCTMPPQIKAQCSEAISLIADVDFPAKWDNLLPELVQRFNSPDPLVVEGVLQTMNSIFKRFRYVQKSDALYSDIIYSLQRTQAPLLTLFITTGKAVELYKDDPQQLKRRISLLRIMCRIFYSFNYQDLPEYFEDHMSEWMGEFTKYLQYQNPVLVDVNEDDNPSPLDSLQAAIIENLKLYADKDEEVFIPYLPTFTSLVWNLLLNLTALPKHDVLATTSIRFLSSLVQKLMHKTLFQEEETLRKIVANIVIPNLMIREVDEERFEDDPEEFIATDIEGSETTSRRKCSQELLRAMCRQFEAEVTAICSDHVGSMLNDYASAPAIKWKSKDVAIQIMTGIAVRAETTARGASQINDKVNVMEFFSSHVLPELKDTSSRTPMLKASTIKFVNTFRNQFSREQLISLMPLLIEHMASQYVVIHTYAAYTIERILATKEAGPDGKTRPKFGSHDLHPFLEPLFTSLFRIIDTPDLNENGYAMKCVMRSLNVANKDILSVTEIVLNKLTAALTRVAKNPRNPQYNHYMFESIAVLIRSVCSVDPTYTASFEDLLFPPFQTVLQLDVAEFTPYVFQVLAQLLEYKPTGSGLGESYETLFTPLLSPSLWESKGNIPALTRLVSAYLTKAAVKIAADGKLEAILGIFQKLVSSSANEVSAFSLLTSLTVNVPFESLSQYLNPLYQILLMRLQKKKTARYNRLVTQFFALFVGKFGLPTFLKTVNSLQPNLGFMLIGSVWIPRLKEDPPLRLDSKLQIVGLTQALCSFPQILDDPAGQQLWAQVLATTISLASSESKCTTVAADDEDVGSSEIVYDSTFSLLNFAKAPPQDPFTDIADPIASFVQSLHSFCASQHGRAQPIIQQGLQSDPKLSASLEVMFKNAGLSI